MPPPALPPEESWRQKAMGAAVPLDPALLKRLDHITRTAARLFQVPTALVSLVEEYRQRFPARGGIEGTGALPDLCCCGDAFPSEELLVIPDARADSRFADHPLVAGPPNIRFYAGCPLKGPRGDRLGTLCLLSPDARGLSAAESVELRDVAAWAGLEVDRALMEQTLEALREAELALKASEANYRALVEAMAEGMVLRNAEGVVLACNPAAARMLGLTMEQILGHGYQDLFVGFLHEDGRPMAPEELPSARVLREGQPVRDVVMGCLRPDGIMVWQLVTAVPMRTPEGNHVVITFADITALREMQAQHRMVLRVTSDIIAVHDVEGRYRYVTPSIQALTGYTPEEVLGKIPHTVAHPQDQAQLINLHRQLLRGERPGALRYRITAKDGREVWIESSGSAVRDARGQVQEVVYTSRDVTREQLAAQGQARLMEIFDRSPDFVAMATVDGTPLYANPALRAFRGYAPGDSLERHHFKDSYPPGEFARIQSEAIPAALATGVWEGVTRLVGAEGQERAVSQVILAHRDVEGQVAYLSTVGRDLTARQEMEGALRLSEARFRAMLDAIPDEMFRVRRDGIYLDVHATQPDALWYPPDYFIGRTLHEILPGEVADMRLAAIHRALDTREIQVITYSLTKDGRTNAFEARTMPAGADETITIVRDLTRQKEQERDWRSC